MFELKMSAQFTLEIKKSKFIAYLVPYLQFKTIREQLKLEHPKARHIVYAYRYLNEFDQIVENLSDDGEPKGSSAPPALAVLRGEELINCAVLIVRYFGGTKLGVGGLVRAYGQTVNEVIKRATLKEYQKKFHESFKVPLSKLAKFEHLTKGLDQTNFHAEKKFESTNCIFTVTASKEIIDQLKNFDLFNH